MQVRHDLLHRICYTDTELRPIPFPLSSASAASTTSLKKAVATAAGYVYEVVFVKASKKEPS